MGQGHLWEQVSLEDLIGAGPATAAAAGARKAGAQADGEAPTIAGSGASRGGDPALTPSPAADQTSDQKPVTSPQTAAGAAARHAVPGTAGAGASPDAPATAEAPATADGPAAVDDTAANHAAAMVDGPAAVDDPARVEPPAAAPDSPPACPQRLLILDTETTGLSPQQGSCIEVGAVLFDVASRSTLIQVSFLLPCEHNPALAVNGIPAAVTRLPQPWPSALACFEAMVESADAVLAHNVAFDRQWFGRGSLPELQRPWICSMDDIRWPQERQLKPTPSVRDLALAHGVPVWEAHRALTDCIYLVQVFQRCQDLETLLLQAMEPRRLVRARLTYAERQLAKDAGFRWNEPVRGAWSRRLSEREIAALPFPVDPIEADPIEAEEPPAAAQGRSHSSRQRSA